MRLKLEHYIDNLSKNPNPIFRDFTTFKEGIKQIYSFSNEKQVAIRII